MKDPLLKFTRSGIYCPLAGIYIDPWEPVERAVITHAHSDHARPGSGHYRAHKDSAPVLRLRLGKDISLQTMEYGEELLINGVRFSLHPAGHIIGSAQIKVEYKGEVWVAGGDYKLRDDGVCIPFEPVKCDTFISESTFGLPIYRWAGQETVINEINEWWQQNALRDKTSILMGYSLGKMQRLIKNLQPFQGPVYAHGAVFSINECLREAGFDLPFIPLARTEPDRKVLSTALILAPGYAMNTPWMRNFGSYSTGYCSGWMAIRGAKNRRTIDQAFVLSDHADWNDLNTAVRETQAQQVFVTHGYTDAFARWLNENGTSAAEVKTMYGTEEDVNADELIIPE